MMDAGKSINPALDVGQIEGAFIQGYGLFCMEQVQVDLLLLMKPSFRCP